MEGPLDRAHRCFLCMEEAEVTSRQRYRVGRVGGRSKVGNRGLHTEDGANGVRGSEVTMESQAESSSGDAVSSQHGPWPGPRR